MLLAAAGIVAVPASTALASPRQPSVSLSPLEQGVLGDINALRLSHHLPTLQLSSALTDAARAHSQEMEADGYFAHTSYDGMAFWKRIQRFYPPRAGATGRSARTSCGHRRASTHKVR